MKCIVSMCSGVDAEQSDFPGLCERHVTAVREKITKAPDFWGVAVAHGRSQDERTGGIKITAGMTGGNGDLLFTMNGNLFPGAGVTSIRSGAQLTTATLYTCHHCGRSVEEGTACKHCYPMRHMHCDGCNITFGDVNECPNCGATLRVLT